MSRSKKNWDTLVDFFGNYYEVNRDVGVERIIAGEDIIIDPPLGVDEVRISVDPDSDLMREGDKVSLLDNDAGYLVSVDELNEVGDVNSPAPTAGQVLTWTGTEWTNRDSAAPDSFRYRGKKNVEVDFPEPDPLEGWTYIQEGASGVTPNAAWVGITTETVDELDLVVYAAGGWTVVKGAFDVISFQDLNAANNPTPQSGKPGGFLDYDPNTATFTLYPADMSLLPDTSDPDAQADTLDERYVLKAGDTMTGALNLNDNDLEAAKDIFLSGTLQLTSTGTINATGNLQLTSNDIRAASIIEDSGFAHINLDNDPSAEAHAVTKRYVDLALAALEADSDDSYVEIAGDTMTGNLVLDSGAGIRLVSGDVILENTSRRLQTARIVPPTGSDLNLYSDSALKLKISDTTTYHYNINMYSGFEPVYTHTKQLVHRGYVDEATEALDADLKGEVERIDATLDNVWTKGQADARYLQTIEVKDTITAAPGDDAEVIVEDKNKFTFTIPAGSNGPKGSKGNKGSKGDRGPTGVDGQKGIDGVIGKDGAKGEKGVPGAAGGNGTNGSKGQKGDKGADADGKYVTRGNSGSNIRIYYSGSRYYIAGTS